MVDHLRVEAVVGVPAVVVAVAVSLKFYFPRRLKFIIVSSGNTQPTWKLVPVAANAGNTPFFSIGRTRTHDLLMTIGPPTQRTTNDFLASQIGQAVQSGISQAATNSAQ